MERSSSSSSPSSVFWSKSAGEGETVGAADARVGTTGDIIRVGLPDGAGFGADADGTSRYRCTGGLARGANGASPSKLGMGGRVSSCGCIRTWCCRRDEDVESEEGGSDRW